MASVAGDSHSIDTTQWPALPGFGRKLEDYAEDLLPSALSVEDIDTGRVSQRLLTLRELDMLQFMNSVTDKVDWQIKVNDDKIAQKWKDEVCATTETNFTPQMADWCIDELRHKAEIYSASPRPPPIFVYNGDVFKSDTIVSAELKKALQDAVVDFENSIPFKEKDWHPGSDGKVWDLVHPSLFPFVYGYSRVLLTGTTTSLDDCIERCGQGQVAPVPPQVDATSSNRFIKSPFSLKFQWLPCEVDISGDAAKLASYINNLHPTTEKPLYGIIEKLIDASIPLWNSSLAPLADDDFSHDRRVTYDNVDYDPDPAAGPDSEGPQKGDNEDYNDFYYRRLDWIKSIRRLVHPEPHGFEPLSEPAPFDLKDKYGHRGLQVIVKLANIQLTPDQPEYEGGSWHVEGQMNEHIVATSLYYYSSNNITTSTLSFRQRASTADAEEDINYEQGDHDWLTEIFGCEQDGAAIQDIGSVVTREGRLLTFPNILQHRVGPFKLDDPTKPGHRKILALFLVDPNIKIASTAHVPCQRQDWWWKVAMSGENSLANRITAGGSVPAISKIPIELQDGMLKDVDFPMSMDQAKELRLELMEERKAFVIDYGETYQRLNTFALCEH